MTRILAIDLSLTGTGMCDDGVCYLIDPGKRRGLERLEYIREVIRPHIGTAGVLVLEGPSFGSQGRGTIERGTQPLNLQLRVQHFAPSLIEQEIVGIELLEDIEEHLAGGLQVAQGFLGTREAGDHQTRDARDVTKLTTREVG